MIDFLVSILVYIISIGKPIIVFFIALFFTYYINIFKVFKGTRLYDDISFDIFLSIYILIFNKIVDKISQYIKSKFGCEVKCIFSEDKNNYNIKVDPSVSFSEDVCYVECRLILNGSILALSESYLEISLPNWVSVQTVDSTKKSSISAIDNNKYKISFEHNISKEDKGYNDSIIDIKIGFIKEEEIEKYEYTVIPNFKTKGILKRKMADYNGNKIRLHNRSDK